MSNPFSQRDHRAVAIIFSLMINDLRLNPEATEWIKKALQDPGMMDTKESLMCVLYNRCANLAKNPVPVASVLGATLASENSPVGQMIHDRIRADMPNATQEDILSKSISLWSDAINGVLYQILKESMGR